MSYSIFKINLEKNKNNVINFWKSNFPSWPENKFTWFYQNNPYGPASCWIIMDTKTSTVVGSTAIFPRKVFVNGKLLLGGITGDFGVDRRYRIVGPALKLQKAGISESSKNNFAFLYGYPNEKSEPIQRRAGFNKIGSTSRMVKILRSEDYLTTHLTVPFIAKLFSKPVDLILKLLSTESSYKTSRHVAFDVLTSFDKRFDELWEKASTQYIVTGERTSEFLNWRFTQCPYKRYNIFAMTRKQTGEILGYIVYYFVRKNVNIADLLVVDMNKHIDALLSEFILFQRKKSTETISVIFFGNEILMNKLKRYQFSVRSDVRNIVVYSPTNAPFSSYLLDINSWYLMEGDND